MNGPTSLMRRSQDNQHSYQGKEQESFDKTFTKCHFAFIHNYFGLFICWLSVCLSVYLSIRSSAQQMILLAFPP